MTKFTISEGVRVAEPTEFASRVTRNIKWASGITTVCILGFAPLDVVVGFAPKAVQKALDTGTSLGFLCSPLLFLVALAFPTLSSVSGPTTHGPLHTLVPRWLLVIATAVTVPAIAAPLAYRDPFIQGTAMTGVDGVGYIDLAWILYACFAAGLLLTGVILAECCGRAELDPTDEPQARSVIARRAVAALIPLAALTVAMAAGAMADAGDRYRTLSDRGAPAPERWAFASDPRFFGVVVAVLITCGILLIGAAIVFASSAKAAPAPAPSEEPRSGSAA